MQEAVTHKPFEALENLNGLLEKLALEYGDRPAVTGLDGPALSFRQLAVNIQNNSQALYNFGLQEQDRIAVVLPQGVEILLSFLSISSFAVFVPLNPDCSASEFAYLLKATKVKALLVHKELTTAAEELAQQAGLKVIKITGYDQDGMHFSGQVLQPKQDNFLQASASDTALLLSTSGTTAQPKLVPLTHANLLAAVRNLGDSLELSAEDCCVNLLPPFHIGALLDLFLAPLTAGGKVVVTADCSPETISTAIQNFKPTWLQAVPTMLNALLVYQAKIEKELNTESAENSLRFIRSVSAALPESLKDEIEKCFAVPVIEIYGMTETTGVICSNPIKKSKNNSVGLPVNQQIKIRDAQGNAALTGVSGEVLVSGANVFAAYEIAEDLEEIENKNTSKLQESIMGDWFRTGDEGYIDEDGYLFLTGRIKEIINRGGEKISPLQVDQHILNFPNVTDAACFAVEHETLGEDIGVALVVKHKINAAELRAFLGNYLAYFKIPRRIFYVDKIPRNKNGKIQRFALSEQYGNFSLKYNKEWQQATTEPAKTIAQQWSKIFSKKRIGLADSFFELGGDSLSALSFITALKETFQVDIHVTSLFENPTLKEFSSYLERRLNETQDAGLLASSVAGAIEGLPEDINNTFNAYLSAWKGERKHQSSKIVGLNTLGERPALFWCVQGYEELAILSKALGENQPLYGLRSLANIPGKDQSLTRPVALYYAEEIVDLQPTGDFFLGGFCEGASFMFEVAKELQNRGRLVRLLCMHDRFVYKAYSGRVAFFFCRNSTDRPHALFHAPEKGWRQFYKGQVSSYDCRMTHSYLDDNFIEFAENLNKELLAAIHDDTTEQEIDLEEIASEELDQQAYQANIEMLNTSLKFLSPGATVTIDINIQNLSAQVWAPTEKSGIVLASRWFNKRGVPRSNVDGRAVLLRALAPGEKQTLQLSVTAPKKIGKRHLVIDLIDEGVAWFNEKGSKHLVVPVSIIPAGN